MRLECFIFDLDGTLYARGIGLWEQLVLLAQLYLQTEIGIPQDAIESVFNDYHQRYGSVLAGLIEEHQVDVEHYFDHTFGVDPSSYIGPSPMLADKLAQLPGQKVVFSNSPEAHINRVLKALDIDAHFSSIFGFATLHHLSKPNIDAYEFVLETLGTTGRNCMMFEDKPPNLRPAKQLGMQTVLVGHNMSDPPDYVDFQIADIVDILDIDVLALM